MNNHDEENEENFMTCNFEKLSDEKLVDFLYDLGCYESRVLSFEMDSFYDRVTMVKKELLKRLL